MISIYFVNLEHVVVDGCCNYLSVHIDTVRNPKYKKTLVAPDRLIFKGHREEMKVTGSPL